MIYRLRSANRMTRRINEALRRDPQIIIIKQRDRIPLARQEDVQNVHDMRPISDHDARLDIRFGDVV